MHSILFIIDTRKHKYLKGWGKKKKRKNMYHANNNTLTLLKWKKNSNPKNLQKQEWNLSKIWILRDYYVSM